MKTTKKTTAKTTAKILFCAIVLGFAPASPAADLPLTQLAWLSGDWQLSSGNRMVEEHWTTPTANALVGMSRTVRDGQMIAFEFLRIEARDHDVFYVAQPNGRPPTDFKLTGSTDTEIVFEGDGKDRVRKVTYRRQGPNGLFALVEGEENGRAFRSEFRYTRAVGVRRLIDTPPAPPLR